MYRQVGRPQRPSIRWHSNSSPISASLQSDDEGGQSSSVFGRLHACLEVGCIQIVWMFRKSLIFDNKGSIPLWGCRSSVNTYTSRAWRGGAGLLPSSQPSVGALQACPLLR
ncbi:hypothetical protein HZB03_00250 [Candidatus Woesearchaeota archaeon]|nr:hypothetical protein [Candidatus Woesearchaeota archaeon]